MGFPRIISKNNKIHTKLGEFCLSCDGSNFCIICHTCQEELPTQDQFWKHIHDEHNFIHSFGKENNRLVNACVTDTTLDASLVALPIYRKNTNNNEHPQQRAINVDTAENSHTQHESKQFIEMRSIDADDVDIDIKVEAPSQPAQAQPIAGNTTPPQSLYQLSQQSSLNTAFSTVVHCMPAINLPALAPLAPPALTVNNSLLSYELHQTQQQIKFEQLPIKNENSTTASASSAVSSDDGERWYICDYETCGLRFKYQSRLELHRSVHSKERRFSCDMCGASFKQSCNLSTHRKKKHFLKGSRSLSNAHMLTSALPVPTPHSPPQQ